MARSLSILGWLRNYQLEHLRGDVLAGLTTAVMLIPQAMAYALLAGLPPIIGLYAAAVPLIAYALIGSSRELAVGPVAMDSLLTAATIGVLAQSNSEQYVALAALLALMVGVIQAVLGIVRGGFLVNFLSRPVISGFTSAAALIIATSQLRILLGLDLPRSTSIFEVLYHVFSQISGLHILTTALSLASVIGLISLKRLAPSLPRALIVVTVAAVLTSLGSLFEAGVSIVGDIPSGLPGLRVPVIEPQDISNMFAGAITIAFVSFMESISVSTKLSSKTGQRVNADREFLALGVANISAGLSGAYPVAGGLSRTAVNADAGAKSQLAGVITALAVGITLLFFTELLYYIPMASLGAIILTAVLGLVDLKEPLRLWVVKRSDFMMLAATFVATLLLGIQNGILIGVGLSITMMVIRTTRPHTAVLGRLPNTEVYRNILRFPEAQVQEDILIVRLDAQFYFGNINFLKDALNDFESSRNIPLKAVVIDASGINQIDASAEAALREILSDYRKRNIRLMLASVKGPVRDVLHRSGFFKELGKTDITLRVHDAVLSVSPANT